MTERVGIRDSAETAEVSTLRGADTARQQALSPLAVIVFFALAVGSGYLSVYLLKISGLSRFLPLVTQVGLYKVVFVLPLSYAFSRRVFTKSYWHLPRNTWKWTCALVAVRAILIFAFPEPVMTKLLAFQAIMIAPPIEEIVRAVMIFPLIDRWGPFWGIVVTTVLTSLAHPSPSRVLVVTFALSLMLVYTNKSIAATALAHFLMNVMTVLAGGTKST